MYGHMNVKIGFLFWTQIGALYNGEIIYVSKLILYWKKNQKPHYSGLEGFWHLWNPCE
jgi:hypothetical protein